MVFDILKITFTCTDTIYIKDRRFDAAGQRQFEQDCLS